MTFTGSIKTYLTHRGVFATIVWLVPVRRIKGQWFLMLPRWTAGNFSWRSINRAKFQPLNRPIPEDCNGYQL